jgi:N-acetylneuraminate synthase/N,N'-diacetyllegionaminate synthase
MRKVRIGNRIVGDGENVFVIAEAGVNHNGNLNIAKKLVDVAKDAGADAIKFQVYKTERIVTKDAKRPEYQKKAGISNSQFDLLKKLELKVRDVEELYLYAKGKDIIFLASAFDVESVDLLDKIGVSAFKVASGEITNFPLLQYIAQKRKPIIISTGMSTINEIEDAISIFTKRLVEDVILLHCVTSYPARVEFVNLRAIEFLKQHFDFPVGFSDHTLSTIIPIAAVSIGAVLIEKHLTLNRSMQGPDHRASLEPDEFKKMIDDIRIIEKALGYAGQRSYEEEEIKKLVRRSIVAKIFITKGTIITEDMLDFKRPGTGIAPKYLVEIIGKCAKADIAPDELVTFEKLT